MLISLTLITNAVACPRWGLLNRLGFSENGKMTVRMDRVEHNLDPHL